MDSNMSNIRVYRLTMHIYIEGQYADEFFFYYRTEEEMKKDRVSLETAKKRQDGSWIPNIDDIEFDEEVLSIAQAKNEMTVSQFEKMFNIDVIL